MNNTLLFLSLLSFCFGYSQQATIEEADLKATVTYLASDALEGRKTGTEGIEKAAQYIENSFRQHNIKPFYTTYRDSFQVKQGMIGYNLIGMQEGTDPKLKEEYIILGAHYDHIGIQKEAINGDAIANGANDNAAGTAAVMALAKYFAEHPTKRSLLFVLFSAEEEGLIGSKHLAKRFKTEEIPAYVMLNFEMIGVPLAETSYQAYLTGFNESNLGSKFNAFAGQEVMGFFPKAKEFQLFKRSDNYPFYNELGIAAQTLCTFDFSNYPYYHHVDDEASAMSFTHMKSLVEAVIPGIEGIANEATQTIKMTK